MKQKQQKRAGNKKRQQQRVSVISEWASLIKAYYRTFKAFIQASIKLGTAKSKKKKKRQALAPRLLQEYLKLDTSSIVIGLLAILLLIIFGAQLTRQRHTISWKKVWVENFIESIC